MTDLADWLDRIEQLHPANIELGLERIQKVYDNLPEMIGDPAVITVAGTNGKGSTVQCITSILNAQGVAVGTYTSPHLIYFNERVCINTEPVEDDLLIAAFEAVDTARQAVELTYFEFTTLAALHIFRQANLDVLVLEVGLGGRLDAVNVVDADVAVITSIGLDHQDWLGETREQIAQEKAGIMRADTDVVCADPDPPLAIATAAHNVGAQLHQIGKHFSWSSDELIWHWQSYDEKRENLVLPDGVVLDNLAGALTALQVLDALPNKAVLNKVFSHWHLPGRLQVIPGAVEWWLDVAHNPDAARILAQTLEERPRDGQCIFVIGMLADKPVRQVLEILAPYASQWIAVSPDAQRAMSADQIAATLDEIGVKRYEVLQSVSAGCAVARARTQTGDRVVVTGSFHTVGPAMAWLAI